MPHPMKTRSQTNKKSRMNGHSKWAWSKKKLPELPELTLDDFETTSSNYELAIHIVENTNQQTFIAAFKKYEHLIKPEFVLNQYTKNGENSLIAQNLRKLQNYFFDENDKPIINFKK